MLNILSARSILDRLTGARIWVAGRKQPSSWRRAGKRRSRRSRRLKALRRKSRGLAL